MVWTVFIVLIFLWALGIFTANTLGGFIHIFLLIASAILIIRFFKNQKPLNL